MAEAHRRGGQADPAATGSSQAVVVNYYPLALVLLMAFAGGWVWRGVYDVWRKPRIPKETQPVVWGTTNGTFAAPATVTWTEPPVEAKQPRLRAVE